MTETRRTSFFALLFFIYFIGVSFLMAYLPLASRLSDSAYMLLSQLICFVPPLLVYFKWSKKNVKETLWGGKICCFCSPSAFPFNH